MRYGNKRLHMNAEERAAYNLARKLKAATMSDAEYAAMSARKTQIKREHREKELRTAWVRHESLFAGVSLNLQRH